MRYIKDCLFRQEHEIHLWSANLDLGESEVIELEKTLSDDEIARANRFRFPIHRKRFVVARGLLRRLLASYLETDASGIKFDYSTQGKPSIKAIGKDRLEFNISHTQDIGIYGFTLNRRLGVDVEYVREFKEVESIAQRFFAPKEYRQIKSLKPQQQQQAFFRAWTGKEAYLKATGEGLGGGLDKVEIELNLQQPSRLISIDNSPEAALRWRYFEVIPAPDYLGAVVAESEEALELRLFYL